MSLFTRACLPPLALALGLAGCTEDAKNGGKETSSTGGEDTSTDSGDDTAVDSGDDTAVDSGDDTAVDSGDDTAWDSGDDTAVDSGDDTASPDSAPPDADADGWPADSDCDDTDASTYPGAEEVCGDGVVNDCDVAGTAEGEAAAAGACLGGEQSLSAATDVLEGASVGSRAGISVAAAADVNGDGVDDVLVGAYGTSSGAGAACLVYPPWTGTFDLGLADATVKGSSGSGAGAATALLRDADGDGFADLLVGGPFEDTGGSNAGAAWLVSGPVSGSLSVSAADGFFTGVDAPSYAGWSVADAGDLDGDGRADLAVGAPYDSTAAHYAGAAYVLLGGVSGAVSLSESEATLLGELEWDTAGWFVASAGDMDGDGLADLLVSATGSDTGGASAGAACLLFGPLSGSLSLGDADVTLYGESAGDGAGRGRGVGDVDGDGLSDLLVGAASSDAAGADAGAAYLVLGAGIATGSLADAHAILRGAGEDEYFGYRVAGAGDVNGDGLSDLLIGALWDHVTADYAGAAYVLLGSVTGAVSAADAPLRLRGVAEDDLTGAEVVGAGDLNGDGSVEVLVGAPGDYGTKTARGVVYAVSVASDI